MLHVPFAFIEGGITMILCEHGLEGFFGHASPTDEVLTRVNRKIPEQSFDGS